MNSGTQFCPIHQGEYKSFNKNRSSCKDCKNKFPYKPSAEGQIPFNRRELFVKEFKEAMRRSR